MDPSLEELSFCTAAAQILQTPSPAAWRILGVDVPQIIAFEAMVFLEAIPPVRPRVRLATGKIKWEIGEKTFWCLVSSWKSKQDIKQWGLFLHSADLEQLLTNFSSSGKKSRLPSWVRGAFQKQSKSNFHSMTSFKAGLHHEEKLRLFICNNFRVFMDPQEDVI